MKSNFADNVRRLRTSLGWTQAELAHRVDMHRPQISRIERGMHHPTLLTMRRIADGFGVKVDRLLK